jgi:uncharacterized protein YndB with AHSA1/START domain
MSCVTRETLLPADLDEVWETLTDPDLREEWLDEAVELEEVVERERIAFTWEREGDGPSHVELTVEQIPAGTRIVVTETHGGPTALAGADARWERRLLALGRAVLLVPA